jgi:hypothetical protein
VAYIEAISYLLLAEAEENHLQCFVAYWLQLIPHLTRNNFVTIITIKIWYIRIFKNVIFPFSKSLL